MADRKMKLDEIDSNFKVDTDIGEADVRFLDVRCEPFEIYGLYKPQTETVFKRLPDDVAASVNDGVKTLALCPAGGRVRFSTDSRYVAVHAVMANGFSRHPHMPLTGGAGMDLFLDDPETGDSRFCRTFIPDINSKGGYTSKIDFEMRTMRHFTINLPNYNHLDALYIGVQKDALVGEGAKYRDVEPVVYYGSSITQGGCASRPGNAYTNVVSRRLNMDFINLGFSGSGRGEDTIVDYMAKLPMSAFVCDYDHNAPTVEHLRATHEKLYRKIRAAHPDIPIILISKPDFSQCIKYTSYLHNAQRRAVILDTYRNAYNSGDKNVYLIDGEGIFNGPYEDMCTVDGCHPNDLGFALMADAVENTIRRALIRKPLFNV